MWARTHPLGRCSIPQPVSALSSRNTQGRQARGARGRRSGGRGCRFSDCFPALPSFLIRLSLPLRLLSGSDIGNCGAEASQDGHGLSWLCRAPPRHAYCGTCIASDAGPGRFFGVKSNSSRRCRLPHASRSCRMPSSSGAAPCYPLAPHRRGAIRLPRCPRDPHGPARESPTVKSNVPSSHFVKPTRGQRLGRPGQIGQFP